MAELGRKSRWRSHPRILGLGGLAVAATAAGIAVWATGASGTTGYRTAVAGLATVRQTLSTSGTAEPVTDAVASFQVAGTIASVDVTLGQAVVAGQVLATLNTTTLQQNVNSAQSSVRAAQAQLAQDEAAQSSDASTTTTTTTTVPSSTGASPDGGIGSTTADLSQAQQKVVTAEQVANADAQNAAAALAQAQTACTSGAGGGGGSAGGGTSPTTTTTTTPPTTTTTTAPTGSGSGGCTTALSTALGAQQQVSTDQKAVDSAETVLAQLLESSGPTGSAPSSPGSGTSATGSSTPKSSTSGSGSPTDSGENASSATDSAVQLATDQAAIDSDQSQLIEAQQSLADASLASPASGTVASVGLSAGQSVSAGSSTAAITIISSGSFEVMSSLTGLQSQQVHTGDRVLVSVDGTTGTIDGTVVRVGPVDTSGSSPVYPMVIALSAGSHGISAGSSAEIEVVLRQATDTLSVPTSAVNTIGAGASYVMVLNGGQDERKPVKVGIVGAQYTQIMSGISEGMTVVLADLSQAVPASSASTNGLGSFSFVGGSGGQFTQVLKGPAQSAGG